MIHTAGEEGSVVLADASLPSPLVASETLPGRSSSEQLVPAVRRLAKVSGWTLSELAAIVVVHGPGSFTGVRVGVSAAKGFSEALGVPVIAISRLALLAATVEDAGLVHAVLDAGRSEFYYGLYDGSRCLREAVLSRADVLAAASGGVVVACQAQVAAALSVLAPRLVEEPTANEVLPFAQRRMKLRKFDDVGLLDANYLRRPYASEAASSAEK